MLAEFCCPPSDIHFRYDNATLAQEGIATQRHHQSAHAGNNDYQRELAVAATRRVGRRQVSVAGRIDGCNLALAVPLLEEYKTTRTNPGELFAHCGRVHMTQLELYAAILIAGGELAERWLLRLLYCHPDTRHVVPYEVVVERQALLDRLEQCLRTYVLAIARIERHRRRRNRALRGLAFPFAMFRDSQRRLARAVYRAARDGTALLAEAPTGSGKTAAALYPSLRAMGDGHHDRTVFLTSRGTGARTAGDFLRHLGLDPHQLRSISITAKHKICFQQEPTCDPDLCQFARGYHDRATNAVVELLRAGSIERAEVEDVARAHHVCPFELTLDAAVHCDVVVCDYNYVFDPVVRLKRLRGISNDDIQLLIDESHQLSDRVRESLSTVLSRSTIRDALGEMGPGDARSAIERFDRAAMRMKREAVRASGAAADDYELSIEWPRSLLDAALRAQEAIARNAASLTSAACQRLAFDLARFARTEVWFDRERFAIFLRGGRSGWQLDIRCLDASAHIAATLAESRSHVRFSATLTPPELFHRLHGVRESLAMRLPSPFDPARLAVLHVADISVRLRDRPSSLERLVDLVATVASSRAGNYLVALPSFDYLEQVALQFRARHPQHDCIVQDRAMDDAARRAFLARFDAEPVVGFIVLGGIFAESVDLPGDRLLGMVVVGLSLPPPTTERDAMVRSIGDYGRMAAYEQPALGRVVQAAGRIIRTPTDRGVVCLVDDRFAHPNYRRYLPMHWRVRKVRAAQASEVLYGFWKSD